MKFYVYLELRFRRMFTAIFILALGMLIGSVSLLYGLAFCLLFLVLLLVYILYAHSTYKKEHTLHE